MSQCFRNRSKSIRSAMPSASRHCKKKANWNLPRLIFVLSALASKSTSKRSSLRAKSLYETSCLKSSALRIFRASISWSFIRAQSNSQLVVGAFSNFPAKLEFKWLAYLNLVFYSSYIRKLFTYRGISHLVDFVDFSVPIPLENNSWCVALWDAEVQN